MEPRTGRRYYPKRSRTFPKRNEPSPRTPKPAVSPSVGTFTNRSVVMREYRWTEDEDQDLSDTETIRSGDAESVDISATLVAPKRRGWGLALFGVKQNAIPKRRKEKEIRFTLHRKSLSLSPLQSDHHPPGLKKRGSLERTK